MNFISRAIMSLFSAPRLQIPRDYPQVRRAQRGVAGLVTSIQGDKRWETFEPGQSPFPVPVRIFYPEERLSPQVILFFHGGGWVTGDIDVYTPACDVMSDLTGRIVVSVDYRLAPENPFPAGLEDCLAVAELALTHPHYVGARSAEDIVLVGDSAGGNLVAVLSQQLVARGEDAVRPTQQVLLYPVVQTNHDPDTSPFESVRTLGEEYRLTNTEVQDYIDLYVPAKELRTDPRVAPLLAEDLSNQPDTLIITAGLDLLRDEAEAYGRRLDEAGNRVQVHRVEDALHGFINQPRFSRYLREGYEVMNEFLGTPYLPEDL